MWRHPHLLAETSNDTEVTPRFGAHCHAQPYAFAYQLPQAHGAENIGPEIGICETPV